MEQGLASSEVLNQVNETAERVGKSAADASRRFSNQFVEYTKKNPPRVALTALAIGAVAGWIARSVLKD